MNNFHQTTLIFSELLGEETLILEELTHIQALIRGPFIGKIWQSLFLREICIFVVNTLTANIVELFMVLTCQESTLQLVLSKKLIMIIGSIRQDKVKKVSIKMSIKLSIKLGIKLGVKLRIKLGIKLSIKMSIINLELLIVKNAA